MKKIMVTLMMSLIVVISFAQSSYVYNRDGEKQFFKVDNHSIIIRINNSANQNAIATKLEQLNSEIKNINSNIVELPIVDLAQKNNILASLGNNSTDITILDKLICDDSTVIWASGKMFVRLLEGSHDGIPGILARLNIPFSTYRQFGSDENTYLVTTVPSVYDSSIVYCNRLFESGLVDYSQPSFCKTIVMHSVYSDNQWGLNNTGQYNGIQGIDINAFSAWNYATGSGIKVAVLDEGVELDHPDLDANLITGYDAVINNDNADNGACLANNDHGTGCAGIIAAENNSIGMTGVAYDAKIVPIRIAYRTNGHNWITEDEWIADGIYKAWSVYGADVLSNSWGGGNVSEAINLEISKALSKGRHGKGCTVVFASGNNVFSMNDTNLLQSAHVSYPANSNPDIIAVGAISQCGQRVSISSCDNQKKWESCYGIQLSVMAPGLYVPTTNNNGEYRLYFSGTSAACPHVAGIAALILSVDTNITGRQVKDIIETTAQKTRVDVYSYFVSASHPNGTWNTEMGYGLADAYAAVQKASSLASHLYIRDTVTDSGIEPSNALRMWNSPDIWIEDDHGHVVNRPMGNTDYKVCVRIFNSDDVATDGTQKLFINWAKAGVGYPWYSVWTGVTGFSCGGNTLAAGGYVGSSNGITIPPIEAHGNTIVRVNWTTPNSNAYANCSQFETNNELWRFSLLARIHDSEAIPYENQDNVNIGAFTTGSNNVALKSISFLNGSLYNEAIAVINTTSGPGAYRLTFNAAHNQIGASILNVAEVYLTLDASLYQGWVYGGSVCSGARHVGNGRFEIMSDHVELQNVYMSSHTIQTMLTEVNFLTQALTPQDTFHFDIVMNSEMNGSLIGGRHFVAVKDQSRNFQAIAHDDQTVVFGAETVLAAESIGEEATYNWKDEYDNVVGTGTSITTTTPSSRKYYLEVTAAADGYKDYDSIFVNVQYGVITSISPNPSNGQTTISYGLASGVNGGAIQLVNNIGLVVSQYSLNTNSGNLQIDTQNYQPGQYTVRLLSNDGVLCDVKKLMIQ